MITTMFSCNRCFFFLPLLTVVSFKNLRHVGVREFYKGLIPSVHKKGRILRINLMIQVDFLVSFMSHTAVYNWNQPRGPSGLPSLILGRTL